MKQFDLNIPFSPGFVQRVRWTRGLFHTWNASLADLIEPRENGPARVLVVIDSGLTQARPDLVTQVRFYFERFAERAGLVGQPVVVRGGETAKNDRTVLDGVLGAIHAAKLCRRSYVVAIGGGAVLDVVGLAAAMAHRGVRLIRVPTTTLSQCDSGVAVKNGINAFGKKNYLGVFAPAWGVVNDPSFLSSLDGRAWCAGFSEVVKVALVKDAGLFADIESEASAIAKREPGAGEMMLVRACELHARHITEGGDPFEITHARPLDFGHWAAHRLETMSGFELMHGEAVAIGIAIDTEYSALAGLLDAQEAARIRECLDALGFRLDHECLGDGDGLIRGLDEFREHLGGRLTVAMLERVGRSVDVHKIDEQRMRRAIAAVHEAPLADLAGSRSRRVLT